MPNLALALPTPGDSCYNGGDDRRWESMMMRALICFFVGLTICFCASCGSGKKPAAAAKSLTGPEYQGNKYYFGFGAAGRFAMRHKHNQAMYDVLHTHDIFTKAVGGDYIGIKEIGNHVNRGLILDRWQRLADVMNQEDMYIQYSTSHGLPERLAVGVSYEEIRDNALRYPAKEIIIFTMACKSGALVDSFNEQRERWQDFAEQGRTLFVMSSSSAAGFSYSGPGRDPDEPNGPRGSAGSAFGHALWKALIGYADGFGRFGVRDGYLSLGEIRDFTIWKTRRLGRQVPQVTGVYDPGLIMSRVPLL